MAWRGTTRKLPVRPDAARWRAPLALVTALTLLAACGTTAYRGAPTAVAVPQLPTSTSAAPPTTPPTTAVPATTAPPTTTPPTTVVPAATTPPTTVPRAAGDAATPVPGTGVSVVLPAGWRIVAAGPAGTADLAPAANAALGSLAPAGVVEGARLVATRDGAGTPAPTIVVALTPRAAGAAGAAGTLDAARQAIGARAAASDPAPEPRVLSGGRYVTYRTTTTVDARPVELVTEHDAFDVGTSVLWIVFTTRADRAAVDGPVFGRTLLSLRTA